MRAILTRKFNRADDDMRRFKTEKLFSGKRKTDKEKCRERFLIFCFRFFPASIFRYLIFLCVLCVGAANFSCRSAPTDMRSLAPAGALVYLETNDLGKTLAALTDNESFQEIAASKPDFSALENVQFAVVVTSFETDEQAVADEQSILNFKPHFVAIADTHRWKPTAVSIAETQIGKFARGAYGDDVRLEKSEKADAKFFVWTSRDGRKIFAAVSGGLIYVGNDESVIDECLEIRRGKAENLLKNENLARARQKAIDENKIAFGYVSPEGVAQIGSVAAVSLAVGATEENDARAFIAGAAPQIFRKSVEEIFWTAEKNGRGIEDAISVSLDDESASVFKETLRAANDSQSDSLEFLPADVSSATRYNLQNPQTAWRSLLFVAAKQTDERNAKILGLVSGELLAPYGVTKDAENFLNAVGSEIITARFDDEGEKSAAIFTVKDPEKVKKSIAEINFKSKPEARENADVWKSESGEIVAAFVGNKLILGDGESVYKCLEAKRGENFTRNQLFQKFSQSKSVAVTVGRDADSAEKIAAVLGEAKDKNKKITSVYLTETDFTANGVERRSVSAFGFIGEILAAVKD